MKKKTEILASNSMYQTIRTYRDIETSEDAQEATELIRRDADREFAEMAEMFQAELEAAGWPPLEKSVRVMPDDSWIAIDDEFRADALSGKIRNLEIEYGSTYIEQRVEPLSQEYFIWKICDLIHKFRSTQDLDTKFIHAFEICRYLEIGRASLQFNQDYTIRMKAKHALVEDFGGGRAEANQERKQKAAKWRAEARTIAKEKWQRNPAHSASYMAKLVQPELTKRGIKISIRTIRQAIGEVKPKVR